MSAPSSAPKRARKDPVIAEITVKLKSDLVAMSTYIYARTNNVGKLEKLLERQDSNTRHFIMEAVVCSIGNVGLRFLDAFVVGTSTEDQKVHLIFENDTLSLSCDMPDKDADAFPPGEDVKVECLVVRKEMICGTRDVMTGKITWHYPENTRSIIPPIYDYEERCFDNQLPVVCVGGESEGVMEVLCETASQHMVSVNNTN